MNLVNTDSRYVSEAVQVALEGFLKEKEKVPVLPIDNLEEKLNESISWLFSQKFGKVAIEDGKIIGYMAFAGPWDGFFGNVRGVFSPLGGNAVSYKSGIDREKVASRLVEHTTSSFVSEGVTSCALSRFAHDEEVAKSLVFNGFGIRCSDLVMGLNVDNTRLLKPEQNIKIIELKKPEQQRILPLKRALDLHMTKAPIFMPKDEENSNEWFNGDNRVFAAMNGSDSIGFMSIEEEAETIISENPQIANINGAYVLPEYRGQKISDLLLQYIISTCKSEGRTLLGVDCETLNPAAIHYWPKYFMPYTYSFTRRIDERICNSK